MLWKWFSKSYTGIYIYTYHVYIYIQISQENTQWILAPPNKLSELLQTHFNFTMFRRKSIPPFLKSGAGGVVHHDRFLIGNPGHQKKVRLQKSLNFTQTSDVLCFTQRPGTKKKSVAKRFQVNYREEQSLRMLRSSTHAWFDSSSSNWSCESNQFWLSKKEIITIIHIIHRETPKVLHQKWKCVTKRLDPTNPFGSRGPLPVNQPYQISPPSLGNLLINP